MQLTVREAAKKAGVTRQTIFKKIKTGELSATLDHRGNKQIDISELLRVYPVLQTNDSQPNDTTDQQRPPPQSTLTTALQLELERAKMQLQVKDIELSAMRERIDELKAREQEAKARERESTEERVRMLGVIEQQHRLLSAPTTGEKSKKPRRKKST